MIDKNDLGVPLTGSDALTREGRAIRSSTARMHSQYVRCYPSRKLSGCKANWVEESPKQL
jgi:hypothetical protein